MSRRLRRRPVFSWFKFKCARFVGISVFAFLYLAVRSFMYWKPTSDPR